MSKNWEVIWYYRCEICEKPMPEEDYNFCDICDDCREKEEDE